ncbi:MAG: response regulator transcription factor [Thermoleophilum sp.]|nr:response regulator transcription factor [Thermoleophilum sp.]
MGAPTSYTLANRSPLLVVAEDDRVLREVLARTLKDEGMRVLATATGQGAVEFAEAAGPDLLVIDICLPDSDGRDVCQALRARGITAPVLFLTARDALPDRLGGFAAGGDDYVTKPFDIEELVARIRALLRRASAPAPLAAADVELDPTEFTIACGAARSPLTPTEFRLAGALFARAGKIVPREELAAAAWPPGAIVRDNTLEVYVARLRRKLLRVGSRTRIETVRGVGYKLTIGEQERGVGRCGR